MYGASLLAGQRDDTAEEDDAERRPRTRTARMNGYPDYGIDDEDDAESNGAQSSGNEWQGGEDDDENEFEGDDEEEMSGDESIVNGEPPSLVVQLRYGKQGGSSEAGNRPAQSTEDQQMAVDKPPTPSAEQPAASEPEPQSAPPVGNGVSNSISEPVADFNAKTASAESSVQAPVDAPADAALPASGKGTLQEAKDYANPTVPPAQHQAGAY